MTTGHLSFEERCPVSKEYKDRSARDLMSKSLRDLEASFVQSAKDITRSFTIRFL